MFFLLLLYIGAGLSLLRRVLLRIQVYYALVRCFTVVFVCTPPFCVTYRDLDLLHLVYFRPSSNAHG